MDMESMANESTKQGRSIATAVWVLIGIGVLGIIAYIWRRDTAEKVALTQEFGKVNGQLQWINPTVQSLAQTQYQTGIGLSATIAQLNGFDRCIETQLANTNQDVRDIQKRLYPNGAAGRSGANRDGFVKEQSYIADGCPVVKELDYCG